MPEAALTLPVLLTSAVLIASGIAKLRQPDSLDGWEALGVPSALRRRWLLLLHPWGELLLAIALLVLGGVLGAIAAAVAALLMLTYTVMVIRAIRTAPDAECACFGARKPITVVTVVRNVWFLVVALVAAATILQLPTLGGAAQTAFDSDWWWIPALIATTLTVALIMWPEPGRQQESAEPAAVPDGEQQDYLPTHTPALLVYTADGKQVNLRKLSLRQATLIVAVKPGCASCETAMSLLPEWRKRIPEIAIRLLFESEPPENPEGAELEEPQALYDPHSYIKDSLGGWRSPAATLLGTNGMLAGGPVVGLNDIEDFIAGIEVVLQEAREAARE